MKTVKCQECGEEIPASSIVCPKCNARCLSARKRNVAAILSICLGLFGVQSFYLYHFKSGSAQLGCTILGAVLLGLGLGGNQTLLIIGVILLVGVFVFGVVEGILLYTKVIGRDAKGKRLA